MPPSDRLSGALDIASTIVGLVSGVGDISKMFSKSAGEGLKGLDSLKSIGMGSDLLESAIEAPVTIGGGILGAHPFADYMPGEFSS